MIYEVLTPHQTNIWLGNYRKTLELYRTVILQEDKTKLSKQLEISAKYFSSPVKSFFSKYWYGIDDVGAVHHSYSTGVLYTMGAFVCHELTVKPYTQHELELFEFVFDVEHGDRRNEHKWLMDLGKHWIQYATKPFHVDKEDVQDYLNLKRLHAEMKEFMSVIGKYDEAFNLVEDR